jgi:hypothetical protein
MSNRLRMVLALTFTLALVVGLAAQEIVTLTTPIVKPSTANCQLDRIELDPGVPFATSRIVVELTCNNGDRVSKQYDQHTVPTGAVLLTTLNRSNNAVGQPSLIAKIYNRLNLDGVAVGTVSGAVQ